MNALIKMLEVSEEQEKADKVVNILTKKIKEKNLFGWQFYIEDAITNTVMYMINTEFKHSIAIYVRAGMQRAITQLRYASSKKRRGNYETISLDDPEVQIADTDEEPIDTKCCQNELYIKILVSYGKELADQLRPIIYGEEDKLERKLVKRIRTQEFKNFIKDYSILG